MPMTTSTDEAVKVEVMPEKWKISAVGGGGSPAWRLAGNLADVQADEAGVYVYSVPEGQHIALCMLNRGKEEVTMLVSQEQACVNGTEKIVYGVTLRYKEEGWTRLFCIGGNKRAVDLRFHLRLTDPPLLRMRFVCTNTGANGHATLLQDLLVQLCDSNM
jgi:hypothetical protein